MKNLKNLGKALSKAEQKEVNGGLRDGSGGVVVGGPGGSGGSGGHRTVVCSFNDGYSWEGSSSIDSVISDMIQHCFNQGGYVCLHTS